MIVTVRGSSSLHVVTLAGIGVKGAATGFRSAILVRTTLVTMSGYGTTKVRTYQALGLHGNIATVVTVVVARQVSLVLILVDVLLIVFELYGRHSVNLLAGVYQLPGAGTMALVTVFYFRGVYHFVRLTFKRTRGLVNAFQGVSRTFLICFFSRDFNGFFDLAYFFTGSIVMFKSSTQLARTRLVSSNFPTRTVVLWYAGLVMLRDLTIITDLLWDGTRLHGPRFVLVQRTIVSNFGGIFLERAIFLRFIRAQRGVTEVLMQDFTETPQVTAKVAFNTVILRGTFIKEGTGVNTSVFLSLIRTATPGFGSTVALSGSQVFSVVKSVSSCMKFSVRASSF